MERHVTKRTSDREIFLGMIGVIAITMVNVEPALIGLPIPASRQGDGTATLTHQLTRSAYTLAQDGPFGLGEGGIRRPRFGRIVPPSREFDFDAWLERQRAYPNSCLAWEP